MTGTFTTAALLRNLGASSTGVGPGASLADKVATGFHRNTPTNQEGGIDVEEFAKRADKAVARPEISRLRASLQGDALTFRDTVSDLTILMALAVFVMYVILAILYESYLHPITVLSSLPVATIPAHFSGSPVSWPPAWAASASALASAKSCWKAGVASSS